MALIKVDLDVLDRTIRKLDEEIRSVESKQNQLYTIIENMNGAWLGQDKEAFETAVKTKLHSDEVQKVLLGLKNTKRRLEDAKRMYQSAQTNVLNRSRTL